MEMKKKKKSENNNENKNENKNEKIFSLASVCSSKLLLMLVFFTIGKPKIKYLLITKNYPTCF